MGILKKLVTPCCFCAFCFSINAQSISSDLTDSSKKNSFSIQPGAALVPYDRMLFGQFIEHFHREVYGGIFDPGSKLSDKNGFRKDVIEALQELKVPIVRWPGGCFASSYHWLDGIGAHRQPVYDKAWQVEDPNTFGTNEYALWCRKIGAEPYICTNAGTGTPEEMSDWVEYCNLNMGKFAHMRQESGLKEPFHVTYWSIGNENYGNHELGMKSAAEWGPLVRESAKMMRRVAPDLKLLVAARPDKEWTLPLLRAAGKYLDYVSIHKYWDGDHEHFHPASYIDCMMKTSSIEKEITNTIDILDESGYRGKIKIAFDEWNLRGWLHPGISDYRHKMDIAARDKNDINSTYSVADALFAACFLNTCLRNARDVKMACFAPMVNATGLLYVYPKGLVKRTTFYVFRMYANQLEKNVMDIKTTSEILTHGKDATPVIDVILTCNDAKTRFVIALVNKDPVKSISFAPDFEQLNVKTPGKMKGTILSGDTPDDYNDVGHENRVIPVQKPLEVHDGRVLLPAHSLVFLTIEK